MITVLSVLDGETMLTAACYSGSDATSINRTAGNPCLKVYFQH